MIEGPIVTFPAGGLVARYVDAGNYLLARYLNQGGGLSPEIELIERISGVGTVIAFVNLGADAIPGGTTHALRLAGRGREVAVYHNDRLVIQMTTQLTAGTFCGVGRDGTPADVDSPRWDNLEVRAT